MAIALVLLAALVGCGGSESSERGGAESEGRGGGEGFERRQKASFALAREVCEEGPKSDFAVESVGIPADSRDVAIARGYAGQWPRKDQKAAFAGCLKGLEKAPARFPRSSPSAQAIWGRSFIVTSVRPSPQGADPPLVEPFQVRFWFSSERRHSVSWKARCNSYAADAQITARRIRVSETSSTAIGCPPGPGREDAWLSDFMEGNPEWQLAGDQLRLVSGGTTLGLKGA